MAGNPFPRINRYIMECKYTWQDAFRARLNELIDTLWNVNEKEIKK